MRQECQEAAVALGILARPLQALVATGLRCCERRQVCGYLVGWRPCREGQVCVIRSKFSR